MKNKAFKMHKLSSVEWEHLHSLMQLNLIYEANFDEILTLK